MDPKELTAIRNTLLLGPVNMARAMGVSYTTYRDWQSGRNKIPPVAARCAQILLSMTEGEIDRLIMETRNRLVK